MLNPLRIIPAQLRRLLSPGGRSPLCNAPRKAAWTRLTLEQLEDRITPAVLVWEGDVSDNWNVAGNWTSGSAPVAGDTLVFGPAGVGNPTSTNDFAPGTAFAGIFFEDDGYTLTGNDITLSHVQVLAPTSGSNIIAINIALTTSTTFRVESSDAELHLSGVIKGGFNVNKTGDGTLFYEGASANTYTGLTTVNAGTLMLNKGTAGPPSGGLTAVRGLVINAGASVEFQEFDKQISALSPVTVNTFSTLLLNNRDNTIAGLTLTGGAIDTGDGTLTLSGNITANAAESPAIISGNLSFGGATRIVTVNNGADTDDDLIIDADIHSGGLNKLGLGKLVLAGTDSDYTLATTVSAGILEVQTSSALGSDTGKTTVAVGATLQINGSSNITLVDQLELNGNGVGGIGALRDVSGIDFNMCFGAITLATTSRVFVAGGGRLILTSPISGIGGLVKTGAGTLQLSGMVDNTFTGATSVNAGLLFLSMNPGKTAVGNLTIGDGASVSLNFNGQIRDTATVTITGTGVLNLNGKDDTITALTVTGGSSVTTGVGILTLTGSIAKNDLTGTATIGGNLALTAGAHAVTVANGSAADDLVISAVISGAGGMTKAGLGTLVLSGANTYAGTTTVAAGALTIRHSTALGATAGGTWVTAGASVVFDTGSLNVIENVTLNGNGVGGFGALQLFGPATVNWFGNVVLNTTAFIGVSNGPGWLEVLGIISGAAAAGLVKTGSGVLYLGGNASNTFLGATTVNSGILGLGKDAGLAVRSLIIGDGIGEANADQVVLYDSNQILDTSAVTVKSSGQLNLAAHNDAIGNLTLTGSGNVTTDGGALEVTGDITSLASPLTATIAGNLSFSAGSHNITVANGVAADDLVISAVISGSAYDLTKLGAGNLVFSAANTYTGETAVAVGTLTIRDDMALGTTSGKTVVTNVASLVIDVDGLSVPENVELYSSSSSGSLLFYEEGITGAWTGTVLLASALASINVVYPDSTLTVNGVISGGGLSSLNKHGSGTLVLDADNDYLGATKVHSGILDLDTDAALGAPSAAVTTVYAGATIRLGDGRNIAKTLALNGAGYAEWDPVNMTMISHGALALTNGESTWSGNIILAPSTLSTVKVTGTELTLSGIISGTGSLIKDGAGGLTLSGASDNTCTGYTAVWDGILTLAKSSVFNNAVLGHLYIDTNLGAGTASVVLNGNRQLIGGNVTVYDDGFLDLGGFACSIGTLEVVNGSNVITGAGFLTLNGNIIIDNTFTGGSVTIASNLILSAGAHTVTVANGSDEDDLVISAQITGAGGLTKAGPGTLVLSGANGYDGNTLVNTGTLKIRDNTALGSTAGYTRVMPGASLVIDVDELTVEDEDLQLGGALQFDGAAGETFTWNGFVDLNVGLAPSINVTGDETTILEVDGIISGGAGVLLTKVGSGVLALSRGNNTSGPISINAGVLAAVNSTGSATGTGTVTVKNGGTLAGNGKVGNVIVKSGGILAPTVDGVAAEVLSTGSIVFCTGAIFNVIIDAGGNASQLNVTGTVSLLGATLNIQGTTAGPYTIINKQGGGSVLGTFADITGDPFSDIEYNVGTGNNDVILTI